MKGPFTQEEEKKMEVHQTVIQVQEFYDDFGLGGSVWSFEENISD